MLFPANSTVPITVCVRAKHTSPGKETVDIFVGEHLTTEFRSVTVDADFPYNVNLTFTAFVLKYQTSYPNQCLAKLAGFKMLAGDVLVMRRGPAPAKKFLSATDADVNLMLLVLRESYF